MLRYEPNYFFVGRMIIVRAVCLVFFALQRFSGFINF